LENKGGGWYPLDWSPDDQKVLFSEYVSINESHVWELDVASGAKQRLNTPGKEAVAMVHARYAKDGKGIYVITGQDSEFKRLAHWEPASNTFKFLAEQIKWDVETFDLSPDGSMIAFVVNEDGVGGLHLLATDPSAKPPKFELPAGSVTRIQWHNNGKALGF